MTALDVLGRIFPHDRLMTDPQALAPYASDRKTSGEIPLAAVLPETTGEVQALVRWAAEHRIPLYPRGAGTNSTGACVPFADGVAVDLTRMNRILELSAADLLARVQPGVITARLHRAALEQGLFYGPDPAGAEESTLGGNVATCAGGPSTLKYGVTRDWLLGLEVVLASGEVIRTGARTAKSVAGLDLTRLFCGSQGILGVITEITVKLMPKPAASATVLAEFVSLERCLQAAEKLLASGILPCALEFMDAASTRLLRVAGEIEFGEDARAALLVRLDGNPPGVSADVRTVTEVLGAYARNLATSRTAAEEQALWTARNRLSPLLKTIAPGKINEDIAVPRSAFGRFIPWVEALGRARQLSTVVFGHLGDGNLHVNFLFHDDQPDEVSRSEAAREELLWEVLRLGGTVTGEHGIGITKRQWLAEEIGENSLNLQRRLKATFDPLGILNPGKIFHAQRSS